MAKLGIKLPVAPPPPADPDTSAGTSPPSSRFKVFTRVCDSKCVPRFVHGICWRVQRRLLTIGFTVDSTTPVLRVVYLYRADHGGGPVRSRHRGVNQTVMVAPTGITGSC
jgi:hypothetical protein